MVLVSVKSWSEWDEVKRCHDYDDFWSQTGSGSCTMTAASVRRSRTQAAPETICLTSRMSKVSLTRSDALTCCVTVAESFADNLPYLKQFSFYSVFSAVAMRETSRLRFSGFPALTRCPVLTYRLQRDWNELWKQRHSFMNNTTIENKTTSPRPKLQ